jgi:hypothetical protein
MAQHNVIDSTSSTIVSKLVTRGICKKIAKINLLLTLCNFASRHAALATGTLVMGSGGSCRVTRI